eukprot:s3899_g2.t1
MHVHLLAHLAAFFTMGNSHGPPQALPYAHPADLLRADQKDEDSRAELRKLVLEASEEILGARAARCQETLGALSDAGYAWATAAAGSLGEEYSELLQVTVSRRPAGRPLRLLNAALHGGFTQRLAPRSEWWQMAMRLHLAFFYLFGRYHHWAQRLLRLRFISLAERPDRNFTYRLLGLVLTAQLLGQLLSKVLAQRSSDERQLDGTASLQAALANGAAGSGASSAPPRSATGRGRLPQCNICMSCPADDVTATPCGHLFCWDCIASWCSLKPSCPLCRAQSPPQKLLPLLHYAAPM